MKQGRIQHEATEPVLRKKSSFPPAPHLCELKRKGCPSLPVPSGWHPGQRPLGVQWSIGAQFCLGWLLLIPACLQHMEAFSPSGRGLCGQLEGRAGARCCRGHCHHSFTCLLRAQTVNTVGKPGHVPAQFGCWP